MPTGRHRHERYFDRLVAMAYADDLKVSGTHAGLQRIIDLVKNHSERWRWTANVTKVTR
jgi:hypothetical protein